MIRPFSTYLLLVGAVAIPAGLRAASDPVDFTKEIQPIFAKSCYECHGEKKQKSSFRLDDRKTAFAGGESGKPAIVPGKSADSALIKQRARPTKHMHRRYNRTVKTLQCSIRSKSGG